MEENQQANTTHDESVATQPVDTAAPNVSTVNSTPVNGEKSPVIRSIERVTVWIMVLSAIMFAAISIMAIWGVLGDSNGEILGRSLGSIAVIAFTALVINIGANMLDRSKKN